MSTDVQTQTLSGEDRVVELSRMLSGTPTSDTAQAHARELLHATGQVTEDG